MYQIKVAHCRTGTKYNLFTPSFDSIPVEYITLAILMSKHDWVAIFRLLNYFTVTGSDNGKLFILSQLQYERHAMFLPYWTSVAKNYCHKQI